MIQNVIANTLYFMFKIVVYLKYNFKFFFWSSNFLLINGRLDGDLHIWSVACWSVVGDLLVDSFKKTQSRGEESMKKKVKIKSPNEEIVERDMDIWH